jgi:starvation-inducible DNA-binding protein
MQTTKNSLPEKVRIQMSVVLQQRLADSIHLMIRAKQAHWNVKGPSFIALHQLFDKVAEEVEEYADVIAERIAQFGGVTEGTLSAITQATSLPSCPASVLTGRDYVAEMSHSLAAYGELIRTSIEQANELRDAGTADIFTQISRGADKNLWFVEAHAQANH